MYSELNTIFDGDVYDGTFLLRKFAYPIYKNNLRRTGNILSFNSPIDFTSLQSKYKFDNMLNFCAEIPDISTYAGVCLFKLFLINVADYFSKKFDKNIAIEDNNLMIQTEFNAGFIVLNSGLMNISQWNRIDNTFMFYLGLFNSCKANDYKLVSNAYSLNLKPDEISSVARDIENIFYNLSHNIYIESAK